MGLAAGPSIAIVIALERLLTMRGTVHIDRCVQFRQVGRRGPDVACIHGFSNLGIRSISIGVTREKQPALLSMMNPLASSRPRKNPKHGQRRLTKLLDESEADDSARELEQSEMACFSSMTGVPP